MMNIAPDRIDQMQSDLAVLKSQNEAMQADIRDIKKALDSAMDADRKRIAALEVDAATCRQSWVGHREQHKTENRNITAIATVVSSAISGAISWFRS